MKRSLTPESLAEIDAKLKRAHGDFAQIYPGPRARDSRCIRFTPARNYFMPIRRSGWARMRCILSMNTLLISSSLRKQSDWMARANLPDAPAEIERLEKYMDSDPETFRKESKAAWLALTIYRRVREKLGREPVEDFRIDFEDGYGNRPDEEEDAHAISTARDLAAG